MSLGPGRRSRGASTVSVLRLLVLIAAATVISSASAAQVSPGRKAPEFNLPLLSGGGSIEFVVFLRNQPLTMLIFWNSECGECVKALQKCGSFEDSALALGVRLLGINDDVGNINSVKGLLENGNARFPQLSDADRRVTTLFGGEPFSFSLVLVDSGGVVQDVFYDRPMELKEVFWGMIAGARELPGTGEESTNSSPALEVPGAGTSSVDEEQSRMRVSGQVRSRAMDIRLGQDPLSLTEPTGLYGETLEEGRFLTHRFELELGASIGDGLDAGALFRLSNEDEKVLELGPQYFANTLGSVYVQYSGRGFRARLGYFDTHFTPLSLMRWDAEDNPRLGGQSGSCACAGAAGAILLGSLEELGPSLTFEGLDLYWPFAPYADVRAFYALPRIAHEVSYEEYISHSGSLLDFRYRRDLYGVRANFNPGSILGSLSPALSLHSVVTRDDEESATLPREGLDFFVPAINDQVYGGTMAITLHRRFAAKAEFDRTRMDPDVRGSSDTIVWGSGFLGTIEAEISERANVSASYYQASEGFASAYSALSYEPGRRGVRGTARLGVKRLELELFAKYLEPVEADSERVLGTPGYYVLQSDFTLGLWMSGHVLSFLQVGGGWVFRRQTHDVYPSVFVEPNDITYGTGLRLDDHVLNVEVGRDFGSRNKVELTYQYLRHTDEVNPTNEYSAHRTSLQCSLRF